MNISKLKENNIKRILKVNGIDISFPFAKYGIELKILDIDDMPDFDIFPYIETANQYIHEAIS